MPIVRRRFSLSPAARDHLTSELRVIDRPSSGPFRRRADRAAVTFRTRRQGRDAVPDQPIPFEDIIMIVASYRRCRRRRGGPRWKVALGFFAPQLERQGDWRVAFRCERALDATSHRTLLEPRPDYTATRAAVLLDQAIHDLDESELGHSLIFPRFYYGFDARRAPHVGSPDAEATRLEIDGFLAWPAERFGQGGVTPLDRRPDAVFASFAGRKGRRVRNPAFALLRRRGLVPSWLEYGEWLSTVSRLEAGRRVFQDPRAEGTEAGRLRRAIQDHLLAEPRREPEILFELAECCHAVGVRVPTDSGRVDFLAELLDNPWSRPAVPYAAAIQVIKLAGAAGSGRMTFGDGVAEADLFDLGPNRSQISLDAPAREGS